MRDGFLVYDTHAHLGVARHSGRRASADDLLRAMDRAGADRAMLIPFPVVDDVPASHDEIAAAVRAHPDRFAGCACIPPLDPGFSTELRRCAEELGMRALKLQPQYHGLNPIAASGEFFFAAAVEHRLPVIVHTGAGAPLALPSLYILPARQFPDLNLVIAHAGGGIYAAEAIVAATVCPNIYVELSTLMPHQVIEVASRVPPSRLMAGSDLPESLETEMGKIVSIALPEGARRDILWNTPRRLFDGAAPDAG
jgi:predicted TIM-barrel fold metal-dependent hydrolase